MSTKSTILLTNCCHIYRDYGHQHSNYENDRDKKVLVIDVSYGFIDYQSIIVVDCESDFAAMILHMVKTMGTDYLDNFCREHWKARQKSNPKITISPPLIARNE